MRLKSDLILLFVAAVWGSGFVAQRAASLHLDAFYFNGGRFLLGALLLLPLTRLRWRGVSARQVPLVLLAGALLFVASFLQQAGLATTTIGNTSFITGLYVVLVPILLWLAWRKRITVLSWVATGIAVVGVGLLSLQGSFHLAQGDALVLVGAFVWALHVILVGVIAERGIDVVWFAVLQFAACGTLSMIAGGLTNPAGIGAFELAWQPVLYSALFPVGLGFTLQAVGQRGAPAVDAAIILSMESVFGTLFGVWLMGERLTPQQWLGCFLIFAAMILAQVKPPEAPTLEAASAD